ncbi:MAG TPA: hypothetical protein VJ793_22070 [Anaerolineae bacterium]|nr:hypothetical protein [Anaerolineae bacterium]
MGLFGRKLADQERAEELFSPYIDGQVTAGEKQFLERYLADHPEAREKFELLQAAVYMTKTLPPVKAPRSFVLPRSMARKPSLAVRMYPALRFATVAAMALFAFALIGDLTTSSRLQLAARAPEMVLSERSREQTEPAASAPAAQLAPAAPAAMATATPEPQATQAPGAAGATTNVDATAVAREPALPAEQATPITDSMRAQLEQPAPTVEASADQSAMKAAESESTSSAEQPPPAQVDALRLAVLTLAGLAAVLGVTTLIIRRRVG